jgi:hypothetical protein
LFAETAKRGELPWVQTKKFSSFPERLVQIPAPCPNHILRPFRPFRPGGRIAIVEFVPNPDRITPPPAAGFGLVMPATIPEGTPIRLPKSRECSRTPVFNAVHAPLPASMNQSIVAHEVTIDISTGLGAMKVTGPIEIGQYRRLDGRARTVRLFMRASSTAVAETRREETADWIDEEL